MNTQLLDKIQDIVEDNYEGAKFRTTQDFSDSPYVDIYSADDRFRISIPFLANDEARTIRYARAAANAIQMVSTA
jgi:hypothetical protein